MIWFKGWGVTSQLGTALLRKNTMHQYGFNHPHSCGYNIDCIGGWHGTIISNFKKVQNFFKISKKFKNFYF
jgi:hypothetical protein